jgi:V8-like Glu-specific endopeptidase
LLSINEKGQWDGKLVKETNFKQPNNTKFVPEASLDKTPYKETGKVFFKMNGKGYVCSGASLVKNVVITAGHCMVFFGNWHKEWIFVPRYRDGEAPLGKWPAIKGLVHDRWRKLNDAARDVAFAIVSKQDGKSISQVVGALGFSSNRGFNVNAIGYPVRNWGGERMVHTSTTIKCKSIFNSQ